MCMYTCEVFTKLLFPAIKANTIFVVFYTVKIINLSTFGSRASLAGFKFSLVHAGIYR